MVGISYLANGEVINRHLRAGGQEDCLDWDFAETIRYEAEIPVIAVGAILGADHANTVLAAGRADLAAMARAHLREPSLTLHAAEHYEYWDQIWPKQYLAAKPQPPNRTGRRPESD